MMKINGKMAKRSYATLLICSAFPFPALAQQAPASTAVQVLAQAQTAVPAARMTQAELDEEARLNAAAGDDETEGGVDSSTGHAAVSVTDSIAQQDPLEAWNRSVYGFNDKVDNALIKPVALSYQQTVPQPVRSGVSNFFANWRDAWSSVNLVLQGRGLDSLHMLVRFTTNSVLGLAGLVDVAGSFGIPRTSTDLGVTLGRWGVPSGPYLVLPLLGPASVRDGFARLGDMSATSTDWVSSSTGVQLALTGVNLLDQRTRLLGATQVLNAAALDQYGFVRNAYLKKRALEVEAAGN